jgi:Sigma-70 region 2
MDELERLYRERYARFRDGLAPVTGSYDTAHDVVQEAFATAFARRRSFRGEGSLEGWVWRIAFRLALRRRGRHAELFDGDGPVVVEPERDLELAAVLRTLPPQQRLIVRSSTEKPANGKNTLPARLVVQVAAPSPAPNAAVHYGWWSMAGPKKSRRFKKTSSPLCRPWFCASLTK